MLKTTHHDNFQLQHLSISNKKLLLGIEAIMGITVKTNIESIAKERISLIFQEWQLLC